MCTNLSALRPVQAGVREGMESGLERKGFRKSTRKLEGDIFNYDKRGCKQIAHRTAFKYLKKLPVEETKLVL